MNEETRELKKISHILRKIGSADLGEEVDAILAELLGNAFQSKMETDLAEKGKLKKKPKFPKAPPKPPPEEGGEEGMPPEEGGELPPGGDEEIPPEGGEGEEPAPGDEEEDLLKEEASASKSAQITITATNIPDDRKWIACESPSKETIKSGSAWTAVCLFVEKKSRKVGYMKRVVSKAEQRPRIIKLGKNKIKVVNDVHAVGDKIQKKLG